MEYGTNWFIQEYLGRIQHEERVEMAVHRGDRFVHIPNQRGGAVGAKSNEHRISRLLRRISNSVLQ